MLDLLVDAGKCAAYPGFNPNTNSSMLRTFPSFVFHCNLSFLFAYTYASLCQCNLSFCFTVGWTDWVQYDVQKLHMFSYLLYLLR